MQPVFTLTADRQDITQAIRERLISLKVTDESGIQSDTLEIRLDDRDRSIRLPRTGAELSLHMGYDHQLTDIGLFVVDELVAEGPPDTLIIRARAADFRQSLKARKSRSWDAVTLGDIVATIASEHELTPRIPDELKTKVIAHIDQTDESDLHFLTRLSKQYDAISSIKQGHLIFTERGKGRKVSGPPLPAIALKPEGLSRYRFAMADRGKYVAAIAHWYNNETAQKIPVRVGQSEGQPVYALRGNQPDEEAAKTAARAKLDALARGTVTGQLTLPGNPTIKAESPLSLTGFREGIDGDWVVTRVEHNLGKSGFKTIATIESLKK
ncbi:contractile injection system protein, VgrG/Pvc8 family [Candidatus Sororendozoicomonas aggregata]|uniref:contractile injection system protein, VgrG/Pvc8 family n=1 Tax=Candidatus Sororendozoicomonas aggregata TaxID=3073239 RepID=UPI002ED239FE